MSKKKYTQEDLWKILNAAVVISSQTQVAKNLGALNRLRPT